MLLIYRQHKLRYVEDDVWQSFNKHTSNSNIALTIRNLRKFGFDYESCCQSGSFLLEYISYYLFYKIRL